MSGRQELHLRVKGVDELRVPGQPFEAYDSYCVCSYGHIRHRTRLVEDSASPKWDEEFVFDAAALSDGSEPVVKFEVYSQGILRDELLFFAYLQLDLDAGVQRIQQQQQQKPQAIAAAEGSGCLPQQQQPHHQVRFSDDATTAASPPPARSAKDFIDNATTKGAAAAAAAEEEEDNSAAIAAAAAALRREGSSGTSVRVPGASAARAAAEEATVAAASAVFRATGSQGYSSDVAKCTVALLPAHSSGSSSGGLLGGAAAAARSATLGRGASALAAPSKTLSKTRLKRSTHVRAAGELVVEVWWVQQPSLNNLGAPPRVLSFVHPPGVAHPLPSSSRSTFASQWEEPPVAFVRLMVAQLNLGHAAAAAADAVGQEGSAVAHAKAVLKQLRQLLKGDTAAAAEEQQQQQPSLPSRPTLADIHGPTSLGLFMRDAKGDTAGGLAGWDWHTLDLGDELDTLQISDEEEHWGISGTSQHSSQQGSQASHKPHPLHPLQRSGALLTCGPGTAASGSNSADSLTGSESDGCTEDLSLLDSELGAGWQQQQEQQQRRQRRLRFGRPRDEAEQRSSRSARRLVDKKLHLTLKIQLGEQRQKALKPVPLRPDGSAGIHQAVVFAVQRPLEEASISYELSLSLGPRGQPLLGLVFQYSLLHLLRRSPAHPVTWEEWRRVARCTVSGLQVPLPCLPGSFLDLSAFLADADCRAGMYAVPTVSAAAMQAAALDDAAAALAAKMVEKQAEEAAAAAAIPARLRGEPEFEQLTDSASEAGSSADDYRVAQDQQAAGSSYSSSKGSTASRSTASSSLAGVLRRRMAPGKQKLDAKEQKQQHKKGFDKLKGAAAAGMERMVDRMGEELIQAVDKLPAPMAQQVKGRFISRLFPQTRRSEVFSIGQLRVMSKPSPAALEHLKQQQHWQQQDSGSSQQQQLSQQSSVSVFAAGVPSSIAGAGTVSRDLGGILEQRQPSFSPSNSITAFLQGRRSSESLHSTTPAAVAAAAGVSEGSGGVLGSGQLGAAMLGPIEQHPNLATAGGPGSAPLGVLQLTLQSINLRSRSSSSSGLQLLMRSGPHWLQLQQPALPLTFYTHKAGNAGGEATPGSRVPPVQVLLPVYGSSCLVALLLHRRHHVVGRCVFKLYGLLPLLIRDHTKTLTLYSDKRGSGGQRIIAGSMLLRLAAGPPPGFSKPGAALRLAYSYLITPHTLEMHTSGVLSSISKDERDDAAGELLTNWLAGQAQGTDALPQALVGQLVSTGRGHLSGTRMRGHVRRIKAVLLDWLPRRLDPLAFYHWKHPSHNLFVLWLLSHVCMYPSQWMFAVAIIVTLVLLRRIAIQIRRGVLGFELEQLPPDMAEAAGVPQQQQSPPERDAADVDDLAHDLASLRSNAGQMGGTIRKEYKDAADKLRSALVNVKQQHRAQHTSSPTPASFPKSLEELRDQLEAGTLNLDSLDVEAAAKQLLSVGGILKLAKHHSTSLFDYALVGQNLLDDAAGFVEGLYAMLTAQDPLAALLFCCIFMSAAGFCYVFGVGAGLYVVICVLLRPPMLRGVPGVFGWKALLANLPSRSVEELMG